MKIGFNNVGGGGTDGHRKWHLVDSKTLCKPKDVGGLGLRDPLDINKAMGVKIWWKWITHQEESCAKLWHETYASHWPKK